MIQPFRISAADVESMGSGSISADVITLLSESRLSRHLLGLRLLAGRPEPLGRAALDLLAAAHTTAPDRVTALLIEPMFAAWLARAKTGGSLDYLATVAAVAAREANLEAETRTRVTGGRVFLPGLGAVVVGAADGAPASIGVSDGTIRIDVNARQVMVLADTETEADGWLPRRRLEGSCDSRSLEVTLEDLDPYRRCFDLPVADRVPSSKRWQDMLAEAWALIVCHLPAQAGVLSQVLRTLVPLAPGAGTRGLSATSTTAPGALAATFPADAAQFAVTLVHEMRHSVLGALHDLVPLFVSSGERSYYAPWRPDSRPIGGLLHGTYAFNGVADVWRGLRAERHLAATAELQFAAVREQVGAALPALASSTELTEAGRRFVAGIQRAYDRSSTELVSGRAADIAGTMLRRNHAAWRAEHAR